MSRPAIERPITGDTPLLLPEGTRLVHIGPPKTGTTALQGAFHSRRDEILAQGVRYAGRARHSGSAVLAVLGRPSFQGEGEPPPLKKWQSLLRDVQRASEPRVVVSSEFFADAEPEGVRRVCEELDASRMHVVVTLRPLGRIVSSQWQQYVQSGLRMSFDAWLRSVLSDPPGTVTPTFWRRHRHDALVARWAEVVGPRNVTVIALDERDHAMVLRVFEQLVGLRDGTLVAVPDLQNRSMTWPEIEAVRAFTSAFKADGLGNALFHKVIHFDTATHMKLRPPGPDEPPIETPQWALDRATQIAGEMVANIATSGVRVVGDLERLAVPQRSRLGGERQPDVCISPEIAARMALGVVIASGLARRSTATLGPGGKPVPLKLARVPTSSLAAIIARRLRWAALGRLRRARRRPS